jgi:hypothetical protein
MNRQQLGWMLAVLAQPLIVVAFTRFVRACHWLAAQLPYPISRVLLFRFERRSASDGSGPKNPALLSFQKKLP